RLSTETRQLISKGVSVDPVPSELHQALISDLNRIIQGGPLYDDKVFAQVTLSPYTKRLLQSNPDGVRLVELNRLLLDQALGGLLVAVRSKFPFIADDDEKGFTWTQIAAGAVGGAVSGAAGGVAGAAVGAAGGAVGGAVATVLSQLLGDLPGFVPQSLSQAT